MSALKGRLSLLAVSSAKDVECAYQYVLSLSLGHGYGRYLLMMPRDPPPWKVWLKAVSLSSSGGCGLAGWFSWSWLGSVTCQGLRWLSADPDQPELQQQKCLESEVHVCLLQQTNLGMFLMVMTGVEEWKQKHSRILSGFSGDPIC